MSKEQWLIEYEEKLEEITEAWFRNKSKDDLIDIFWEDKMNDFDTMCDSGELDIEDLYREYCE